MKHKDIFSFFFNEMAQVDQILPRPGVGVTKQISFVPLFSACFNIVKTHVIFWISYL